MNLQQLWKNLSVSKKLYAVIGVMAFLIALELVSLYFAMSTLSSVRAFVNGESLWSKSQKESVISLHKYARTWDEAHYQVFQKNIGILQGDERGRIALEQKPPDVEAATREFLNGGNHPEDVPRIVSLFLNFRDIKYVDESVAVWEKGDQLTAELEKMGLRLHELNGKASPQEVDLILQKIDLINDQMTLVEKQFSNVLGEGSRWLESTLMVILILAVLTVEGSGLLLTVSFSRNLSKDLRDLIQVARKVEQGDFGVHIPVKSQDEVGQLAESLNAMARALKNNVGERRIAEQSSQLKSLFLANMSHEIRTPLAAIIGFSDLLKDEELSDAERKNYINIIQRTGENLTRIINDILDLSKVEAGHMEIKKSAFSLTEVLDDIHAMMVTKCEGRPIDIEFNRRGVVPDKIYTDPQRLRQILVNLLGNAIKFTEQGFVRMTYEVQENWLLFTVRDTGVGIPEDKQDLLFHHFSQVDSSSARRFEGTGLGLVLSKKLAELLGGDVFLKESAPGKGSTFTVRVAVEFININGVKSGSSFMSLNDGHHDLSKMSVLLVDDVEENRLLIQRMLEKRGVKIAMASNGEEGVKRALSENYDVVLMDIQMPLMDGYQATQYLRDGGFKKPIIALTAHAMKEDRDRCLSAGFTEYLTKPIQINTLIDTIVRNTKTKLNS